LSEEVFVSNITIADLAKHCGVSTATVSMVLTNKGRISQRTRERVLKAVDELGYVYNQAAANLRHKRTNLVGLLIHDLNNPFYADMITGLSHYLENQKSLLFLANAEENVIRQQEFIESLLSQNAGGMVLCPTKDTDIDHLRTIQKRGFPIICAVRPLNDDFDFVGIDNVAGVQLAMDYLIKQGHKHIAFVGGQPHSHVRSLRLSGYISKLIEYDLPIRQEYISPCKASRKEGTAATKRLLERFPEITAIIGYQDIVALGVIRALQDLGLQVGKQVAVIGFDDVPEAVDSSPSLTTVSVPAREIGRVAGELLTSRMRGDPSPPKKVILSPKLIVRESTL
jgi:LacI family transcriptional regulator